MKIIKYISKSEQLLGLNNFILSAFNLAFLSYYMDKKINIDDLITHEFAIEDINKAFDLMHEGKSIRSVINF